MSRITGKMFRWRINDDKWFDVSDTIVNTSVKFVNNLCILATYKVYTIFSPNHNVSVDISSKPITERI